MRVKSADYDKRLLRYIEDYTREVGVPPTLDSMIDNVYGITSKSTLHNHLQNMVESGLLVQKNVKGYYYPTSIDLCEVSVPKVLLKEACNCLKKSQDNVILVSRLSEFLC